MTGVTLIVLSLWVFAIGAITATAAPLRAIYETWVRRRSDASKYPIKSPQMRYLDGKIDVWEMDQLIGQALGIEKDKPLAPPVWNEFLIPGETEKPGAASSYDGRPWGPHDPAWPVDMWEHIDGGRRQYQGGCVWQCEGPALPPLDSVMLTRLGDVDRNTSKWIAAEDSTGTIQLGGGDLKQHWSESPPPGRGHGEGWS